MKFKVIPLSNPEWDNYIHASYIYDFHHTSAYHKIECQKEEEAFLFVAEKDANEFIAFPLIIRGIPGTDHFDATSVYGYGGPVASKPFNEEQQGVMEFFKTNFLNYCDSKKIISVFSRLHPLIEQDLFFCRFGIIKELNKVVAIDLTEPVDIQRQHYSRSYKNQINKLKNKKGYSVTKLDKSEISIFKDIYIETMNRVEAKNYYFFSDDYLKSLVENRCFDSEILIALDNNNQPVSAAIFTITKGIMQYHLGGTKDFALNDSPIKLIMDEARLLGSKLNLQFFNLGGGVGGSDDDSLFRFKAGFSKNFYQFSVWNLIVNQDVYDDLVNQKNLKEEDFPNFFPLYRAGM